MTGHSKSTLPPSLTATEATAMSAVTTTDAPNAPNATNDNNEGGVNPYSMMHRTLQSKEANYVTHILPNDVLLGRGTGPNDHPGNVTFRNLIKDQFNNYKTACIRGEKTKMAKRVVTYIRNQNGRFLRRLDAHEMPAALADPQRDHHLVEDAEVYLEIKDDRLLVQKTKQAFRHLIRQAGQSTSQSQSPSTSQGAGTGQDQGQGHFAPLSRRSKARSASMSMRSRSRSRSPDTVSSGESGVAPRSYGRARRLSAAASASTSGSVSASVSTSHSRAQLDGDGAAGLVGHTGTNMDVEMNAGMGVGMGMGMGANGHAQAGAGAAMGESGAPPVSMISIQKSALAPTFSTSSLDSSVGTNSVTHRHATGAAAGVSAPNAMLGAEADIDARLAALRVSGLPGLSAAAAAAAASRPSQLSSLALQHQRQQQLQLQLRQQQQQQQQQRDSQLLKLMAVNDAQLRSRLAKAQLLDALSTPGVSAGGIANAAVGNGTGNPSALAQLALASQPSQLAAPMSAPNTSDVLDAALRLAASRKMAALQSALGATAGVGAGVGAGGLGVGAPVSATAAAAASAALAARSGGVVRPGMGDRHSLLLELLAAEQTMRQPAFR